MRGITFSIGTSPDLRWISKQNSGNLRSDLGSSKLNKIVRDGLKINEFVWRYKI
jgi:hypothetical protein